MKKLIIALGLIVSNSAIANTSTDEVRKELMQPVDAVEAKTQAFNHNLAIARMSAEGHRDTFYKNKLAEPTSVMSEEELLENSAVPYGVKLHISANENLEIALVKF